MAGSNPTTPTLTKQEWLYIGRRMTSAGKTFDYFTPVGGTATYPYKAQRRQKIVGGVYEVEATADGSTARVASAPYLRMHDNKQQILAWKALHDAAEVEVSAVRHKGELQLEALDALRKQYWATNAIGRRAIEVCVLGYLRQEK